MRVTKEYLDGNGQGEDRNEFEVCKVGEPRLCVCGVPLCAKNCKSVVKCLGIYFT